MRRTIYKPLWQIDCGIGNISKSIKLLFLIQAKHDVREGTTGHRVARLTARGFVFIWDRFVCFCVQFTWLCLRTCTVFEICGSLGVCRKKKKKSIHRILFFSASKKGTDACQLGNNNRVVFNTCVTAVNLCAFFFFVVCFCRRSLSTHKFVDYFRVLLYNQPLLMMAVKVLKKEKRGALMIFLDVL